MECMYGDIRGYLYKMQIAQMSKLQNAFVKISVLHESWNVSQTVVM